MGEGHCNFKLKAQEGLTEQRPVRESKSPYVCRENLPHRDTVCAKTCGSLWVETARPVWRVDTGEQQCQECNKGQVTSGHMKLQGAGKNFQFELAVGGKLGEGGGRCCFGCRGEHTERDKGRSREAGERCGCRA